MYKKLKFKNYLSVIKGSIGSNMFKNCFCVDEEGNEVDVIEDGVLSCAHYVSSILQMHEMIIKRSTTVLGLISAMAESGWEEVSEPYEPGDVLVWEARTYDDGMEHMHVGFYLGNNMAVSNSTDKKVPVEHSLDFDGGRKIVKVFRWKGEE